MEKSSKSEHQRPGQVFARRVKEERKACGWNQQELVDRLRDLGYPISRPTLIRIEAGGTRAEKAPLQEVLALAAALGVHPGDLIAPLKDEDAVAITPNLIFAAPLVREWVRGDLVLPMTWGVDLEQISDAELRRLLEVEITRRLSPATRERARADLAGSIDYAVKFIRNPYLEGETDGSRR
jgi:transcriptional regulator with XRE-family HTH domain